MLMIEAISVGKKEFPGTGEVLIFMAFEDDYLSNKYFKLLDEKTNENLSSKCKLHEFKGKADQILGLEINSFYNHIILIGVGKKSLFTLIIWRNALANAYRRIQQMKYTKVVTSYVAELGKEYFEIGKQLAISFHISNYSFDEYKSSEERKKITKLQSLEFITYGDSEKEIKKIEEGIKYGKNVSQGIALTRDLVNQPASHQSPESLVQEAFIIEKESHGSISVEILDEDECRRLGMGAFLGVAKGSEKKPKFIVLHYKNAQVSKDKQKKICLIGKSIIFDSGGLSLKPASSMETMKCDMAGGATVLGVFSILARSNEKNLPEVYGILPACENMPSGKAIRPGDVVIAMNKKTIEVKNTDAEGRLTLADALSYAEEKIKPDVIIDLATLTGACMVALGKDIAGVFGNNDKLLTQLETIAKKEGDELWRLPLFEGYKKDIKGDIADLRNAVGKGYGGAINAALFLNEFVKKTQWVHLDIAGPAFNEGESHDIIPKGGTGWGILTLLDYLRS